MYSEIVLTLIQTCLNKMRQSTSRLNDKMTHFSKFNGKFHIDNIISNFIENIFHFFITKNQNTPAYELLIILLLVCHDRASMIDCTNLIFFRLHSDAKHIYTNKLKIKSCKTGTQSKMLEIAMYIFLIFFVKASFNEPTSFYFDTILYQAEMHISTYEVNLNNTLNKAAFNSIL